MTEETLRVLEFDKVRELLAGCTVTAPGAERARLLVPHREPDAMRAALAGADEALRLLADGGAPPLGSSRDLRFELAQLHAEGSWLPAEGLLAVLASIETAGEVQRFMRGRAGLPLLCGLAAELAPLKELGAALRHALGPRGEILDRASFELGELRRDLLTLRNRIRRSLEELLAQESLAGVFQDRIVTERGGRYVVPVRSDHRGRVKGFVHDESASGQTLYVEPTAILERNNELQHTLREEQREEERILRQLGAAVRGASAELAHNQEVLTRLDLLTAVGRLARSCDAVVPELSEQPLLELGAARHPLLLLDGAGRKREQAAVPIDLRLGDAHDTLVISGPNTGGKSVALKTAGLLVLMVRAGLPIPCAAGSRLYPFAHVFADIGDEQSIEQSLSTFSGHLTRIGRILAAADGASLVLLDELGTGTDPVEGGALALAVLDALRERGARCIVTTHLNLVKGYALLRGGVENAAVEFDAVTLAPSYRLHYGIPGASNAFVIARRLGLDTKVIARAEGYLSAEERDGLNVLDDLNRLRREAAGELAAARREHARTRQEFERQRQLRSELESERRTLREKAARRADELVRKAEARVQELFAAAGSGGSARERAQLAGELGTIREELAPLRRPAPAAPLTPVQTVRPGETVRIPALNVEAEVVRSDGPSVELLVQGKKLRLPLAELESVAPSRGRKVPRPAKVRGQIERDGFTPRLLLVGKRADDALLLLDRFLDDALLHNAREVEIVHGAGEGILRKVVREFLAGHREVTSFHAGDISQGGENVTVAGLRGA